MPRRASHRRTAALFAGAALMAAGVLAGQLAVTELRIMRLSTLPDHALLPQMAGGLPPRGASLAADRALLLACDELLGGRLAPVLMVSTRQELAAGCGAAAQATAQGAPDWALPQYLLARLTLDGGAPAHAAGHLARAQEAAPYESWLGERRLRLALDLAAQGEAAAEALIAREVGWLALSPLGQARLAELWQDNPAWRAPIEAAIDAAGPEAQRRFLADLRLLSGDTGG